MVLMITAVVWRKLAKGRPPQSQPADRRHGLYGSVKGFALVLIETQVHARNDWRLPHQPAERLRIHHALDAEVVFDQRIYLQGNRAPGTFE